MAIKGVPARGGSSKEQLVNYITAVKVTRMIKILKEKLINRQCTNGHGKQREKTAENKKIYQKQKVGGRNPKTEDICRTKQSKNILNTTIKQ